METIQTYKGHKPDRTFVIKKRDLSANGSLSKSVSVERDQGYSSLNNSTCSPTGRKQISEVSKDLSSLSLLTTDDATAFNSPSNSPNSNPRKTILNNDTNNNPYATPKQNRNSLNAKIQSERERHSVSPSIHSRYSPSLRNSTPSPIYRRQFSYFNDFELDCLRAHNEYRARLGVPALKLNKKLCKVRKISTFLMLNKFM